MLSYDDALARILAAASPLPIEEVALADARGRALAADLLADRDLPPFDNSAVDGYALRAADLPQAGIRLPIRQTVAAGDPLPAALASGHADRIFTGAPVPPDADRIVLVEDTEESPEGILFQDAGSSRFIRRRGSDLAAGQRAIPAGATLGPGEIGLLASLNRAAISCSRCPRVGLLTTGDELIPVGDTPLGSGQIRDSNGPALEAAVAEAGGIVAARRHARDSADALHTAFEALLAAGSDLILSTGGVSMGGTDQVKEVLQERGRLDFWRIALKPGKPLAFGAVGDALFFGLPGNPVSSLVTFELFVRPVLRRLAGHARIARPQTAATLATDLPHERGRREFVRARLSWEDGLCRAAPTGAQGSHRLHSMVGVDALLIAHEDRDDYRAGETLPALLMGL